MAGFKGFKVESMSGATRTVGWLSVVGGFLGAVSTLGFALYLLVMRSFDTIGLIGLGVSLVILIPSMITLFRE